MAAHHLPGRNPGGVYQHLVEEVVDELPAALNDPAKLKGEIADCLMLALCLAWRSGLDPIAAIRAKHAINLQRTWAKTERGYRHTAPGYQPSTLNSQPPQ